MAKVLLASTFLLGPATSASALFGPVCVPTVINCMCTYRVPCPINSTKRLPEIINQSKLYAEKLSAFKSLTDPNKAILDALGGSSAMSIPGLSIDSGMLSKLEDGPLKSKLQDALNGDISDRASIEELSGQLDSLGLNGAIPTTMGTDIIKFPASIKGGAGGLISGLVHDENEYANLCLPDGNLISVEEAPNAFGDSVAAIDLRITEIDTDTNTADIARFTDQWADLYTRAYARSIQARPVLMSAAAYTDDMEEIVGNTATVEEDWRANTEVHERVRLVRAENTSLMSSYLTVLAADTILGTPSSPVALHPHGPEYIEAISLLLEDDDLGEDLGELGKQFSEFQYLTADAVQTHNVYTTMKPIENSLDGVMQVINEHEARKTLLLSIETRIKAKLNALYIDGDEAWRRLRPMLNEGNAVYEDQNRYKIGAASAAQLNNMVTAQSSQTALGVRKKVVNYREAEGGLRYSYVGPSPYRYGDIDGYFGTTEPFTIIRPTFFGDDQGIESKSPFDGLFQYYLEMDRRTDFLAKIRRGSVDQHLEAPFWSEMMDHAPECLSAPISVSSAIAQNRLELVDLSVNCDHLTWEGGDQGDYIDPSALAGADMGLWTAKIALDKGQAFTQGETGVRSRVERAINFEASTRLGSRLLAAQNPTGAANVKALLNVLEAMKSDQNFDQRFTIPVSQ